MLVNVGFQSALCDTVQVKQTSCQACSARTAWAIATVFDVFLRILRCESPWILRPLRSAEQLTEAIEHGP